MVGDHNRPKSPERRDLLGVEPGRAVQAWDEDGGKRFAHLRYPCLNGSFSAANRKKLGFD
jgi:hypothetical protein